MTPITAQTRAATSTGTRAHREVDAAVVVEDLRKTYPGGRGNAPVEALAGVSFEVEPGTIFGLLGPNGAGKSTTIRICTTLSRPTSGTVRVAGIDVVAHPDRARRAIGVVSQQTGVDVEATGRENLRLQGRLYGLSGRDLEARATELLDRLGLTEAADRRAATYSGGMQRRLDIALGLVHRPRILFLDEPTTGLDPEIRVAMWREIAALTAEDGLTVVLTTHYLEEVDRLADRLAILDRGAVVAEGTAAALKAELRGDAVQIEMDDPFVAAAAGRVLRSTPGVIDVTADGAALHARVESGPAAVPGIVAALEDAGCRPASIRVAAPSLDDVYLAATGRVYAAADPAPAA